MVGAIAAGSAGWRRTASKRSCRSKSSRSRRKSARSESGSKRRGSAMMAPVAERHLPDPRRHASGAWTTARGLHLTLVGPFQANIGRLRSPFFADRAEARLETSRRAYSGLDPLSSAHRAGALWVSAPHGRLTT